MNNSGNEEMSKSRKILEIINYIIDYGSWIIIAVFIYMWWISRGQPVGCERITADLCNYCFAPARNIGLNLTNLTIGGMG